MHPDATPSRRITHSYIRGGFSLIELLAVIGIIAVLIGFSLPAFAGIRRTAKSVRCQANLRSILSGLQAYREDHQGLIPWSTVTQSTGEEPGAFGVLADYIGVPVSNESQDGIYEQVEPYVCPSDIGLSELTGFSYAYRPSSFMQVMPEDWSRRDMIEIMKLFTEPQVFQNGVSFPQGAPVIMDSLRFHLPESRGRQYPHDDLRGYNQAFLDGSVRVGK
jgi:prepilin-type N-terminal cleavage/methylation domain-containing protein